MIRKKSEQKVTTVENLRGGAGSIIMRQIADKLELYEKSRLFAHIIIKPGCSIGHHVHENEMEAYYILSGTGTYDYNGVKAVLSPGDTTITMHGEGHSITNEGSEDLEMIALVVLQ